MNAIFKEDVVYTWLEGSKDGYRMNFANFERMSNDAPQVQSKPDYDKTLNLDCTPTNIPDSAFQPPEKVNFQDLTRLMEEEYK